MTSNPVSPTIAALDLERTLIDDALSGSPRPGLFDFVRFCLDRFERVVLFTTVEEQDAREVVGALTDAGAVPEEFLTRLEYVAWSGEFKDIAFVPDVEPERVVLVDDDGGWVRPDQRGCWIEVVPWDGDPADRELWRVKAELVRRMTAP
jgi:hypothetical protein